MGIEVFTQTATVCDIPGCKTIDEITGSFPDRILEGWAYQVLGLEAICPRHTKQLRAIIAGKKVRGPDKEPRRKAQDKILTASTPEVVETPILAKKRGRKAKEGDKGTTTLAEIIASANPVVETPTPVKKRGKKGVPKEDKAVILPGGGWADGDWDLSNTDSNICEPGKPQFQKCPGCGERPKCTLDGVAALSCWDKRNKK